jgi:ketosteroid isomerase-like protein
MAARPESQTRSREHHVGVGLRFWSSFKNGDIDGCVELLHPDVEWHPTPRLDELDVVRGRDDVHSTLDVMHEGFGEDLDVLPEDGRQVGDHVLMITVLTGHNQFTKQPVKSRECWVVSVRDDKLARIVVYPNAPAARLGFEELLKTAGPSAPAPARAAKIPPATEPERIRLAPEMENSAATPAELANVDTAPAGDGPAATGTGSGNQITLSFSFEEAEALNRWLLKPSQDGGIAADDSAVMPGLLKIRTAVEQAQAISAVRHELEQAGVPTQHLSDQQVAQLGRRISQAAPRLGGQQG